MMKITGTFIDEISHDIPHQNWGPKEWDTDFQHMKNMGIDTVILIRSGYQKFITYPSNYLQKVQGCYRPSTDLVALFLQLSDKYGMKFYFGLYDSGDQWDTGSMRKEIDTNRYVIEEVWKNYGHHKSFAGWYLSMEISRRTASSIEAISALGKQCKDVSNNLPTFISPWIDGRKSVLASESRITKAEGITVKEHEEEWNEIFSGIKGAVDAVAFQDGHIDYHQLQEFFHVNKKLADRYGFESWTNAESFDRDMPIKFMPIKFDKLRLKLNAAAKADYDKAITFEFSHFMSPQSAYRQAGHLYNRYLEYVDQL